MTMKKRNLEKIFIIYNILENINPIIINFKF